MDSIVKHQLHVTIMLWIAMVLLYHPTPHRSSENHDNEATSETIGSFYAHGTNKNTFCFVASLASPPPKVTTSRKNGRRHTLSTLIGSTAFLAGIGVSNKEADAAIDVSSLRVEPRIPTSSDVFLGGPYFADDDDAATSEEILDRIGRMKYTIELKGLGMAIDTGGTRLIIVKGRSSTISSQTDSYIEYPGQIFSCPDGNQRQCISIDFSTNGGSPDAKGYWDAKETGIRFLRDNQVWSKQ